MRPIGVFPSVIYAMCRSISMLRSFREGSHLERLTPRKPATSEPSTPSGNPTIVCCSSCSYPQYLSSSRLSRSSWFLKSVTDLLSSRGAAWTESTRSRVCFVALASASSSTLSYLTELLVACMSARSSRNAGVSTEFTASLTVEAIAESEVLCCSLNASLIPLAIASLYILSGDCEIFEFFLYWRLPNLSFPIALDCWSTHDGSDAKWFDIYWQDYKIFD